MKPRVWAPSSLGALEGFNLGPLAEFPLSAVIGENGDQVYVRSVPFSASGRSLFALRYLPLANQKGVLK